jgi:hypothetical protein
VNMRYEPAALPLPFAPKARSHDSEYASYVPAGILRTTWLERHHAGAPAVIVSEAANARARWDERGSAATPTDAGAPSSPPPLPRSPSSR